VPACSATNGINYQGVYTAGQPAANFNLGTLTDGSGKNLTNITGTVTVAYFAKDACGVITKVSYLLNIIAPIPPVVNLEIYNKANSQAYLPASQNLATPVNVGSASIGYRINNSTGTIESLNVTVQQVDATTGAAIGLPVINKTTAVSGVSGYTYEALNQYCVPASFWLAPISATPTACSPSSLGNVGYFSYTNAQYSFGKTYKITVTLSNACNTNSQYSYVVVGSIGNKIANPNGGNATEVVVSNQRVSIYPNPATNVLNFDWETTTNQQYTLQVTDVLGKIVSSQQIAADQSTGQVDISTLTKGVYLYQVIGTSGTVNGKFIKQ
jgi:hypothetical protein